LVIEGRVGSIPVTVFDAVGCAPAPTVVIAHGFSGSQQLMQPYAVTLARNGYRAVTFDFPGHGRNPDRFVARIEDEARRVGLLLGALEAVVQYAAALPGGDGRVALLGHSMAGDVLVRYAAAHREQVAATVLVSPYLSRNAPVAEPRDLLFIFGALEPKTLHQVGHDAIANSTGTASEPGKPYQRPMDGTARAMVLVEGAEHIGVLYGSMGLKSALDWLDQSMDRRGDGYIDSRGAWLGCLFLGILALAWPLSRLLPQSATAPLGAGLSWRKLWPVALAPAILTPIVLRLVPSDYLPILLGDYLALHFGTYGLITLLGILLARRGDLEPPSGRIRWPALLIAAAASGAYATLAIAWPLDAFVTSFFPSAQRLGLLLAILPGTVTYFVADGWLVRGPRAARGGGVVTKLCFMLSLLLAVALNLRELFFLIIIVPAILVFFVVYGLLSGWVYQRTWNPLVGAIASGFAFAWAIAVTFPVAGE
jgi:pimeloyl-ACP methyl ester carboxylesterase